MYVLETNNLSKNYNGRVAVENVNMHIEEGDIYGFVGENGAGKTTIIRLITGLSNSSSGDYNLFGINSNSKEIYKSREKMGGIVEAVSLSLSMTAKENIELESLLVNKKLSDAEKDNLLLRVGLDPASIDKKKVSSFSLGMKQRLGIAITLISNPKFIVLDEPMNGLDPKGFIEIRDVILKLNSEGITFLISSHILSELDRICNKIGFISHGRLLKELSIEELHSASKPRIIIDAVNISNIEETLKKELNLLDTKIENNILNIYDDIDINEIIKSLVSNNIKVNNISKIEETIETYYMKLIGGILKWRIS